MRKSLISVMILLASIISPFEQIGLVSAQMNPDVSISCDPIAYEYEQFVWNSGVGDNVTIVCLLENPTTYNETIVIHVTSAGMAYDAPDRVVLEPLGNESISIEIAPEFSPGLGSRQVTVSARVDEADGAPCPTCTSQTTNLLVVGKWAGTYILADFYTTTHQGAFVLELLPNAAPNHVESFETHAQNGMYNGSIFHRVIDDFMIQAGDFENSNGAGGYSAIFYGYCDGQMSSSCNQTSWTIPDEADNGLLHVPYALSMAKYSAPHTGGSQFFIVDNDSYPSHLDGVHSVFGHVIEGFDEIDYISQVSTASNDRPLDDVIIGGMRVVEWPFVEESDIDGDGVSDSEDAFPEDANESADSDGDGTGDNADVFPNDENETHDDDNDGVGNNSDAFPQDANETHDDDNDGVGNNSDAFPQDPDETVDTDGDGVGDNSDADPEDPSIQVPADIEIKVTNTALYVVAGAVLLLAAVLIFSRRRPPMSTSEQFSDAGESIWNEP